MLIALIQALFRYIVRSLLPLPITVNKDSSNLISEIFIPTNSDKRMPQFKNNVIIAKSLSAFFESSLLDASNNFWESSSVRDLGSLLSNCGVSKFCAGLFVNTCVVIVKYLKNILIDYTLLLK